MSGEVKVPKLLTLRELAAATGIQLWRLYELVRKGEGPAHVRIGKTYRFAEPAVLQWIQERQQTNNTEETSQ